MKIDINIDPKQVEAELCKRSLFFFFKKAWNVLEPATTLDLNWHHEYICNVLQTEFERWLRGEKKEKDIIINVPPRTTKSLIVNVCFPVWCWIKHPPTRIISSSHGLTLSTRQTVKSRTLIESNWFISLFSNVFTMKDDENKKSFYVNDQTGMRMAVSTGSSVTGEGGNIFIYDDSLNPEKANSDVEREGMITWYKETSYNRLNDQSKDFRIVIEQRLHERDLTGYLLSSSPEQWRHICIPAELLDRTNASPEVLHYYRDNLFWESRFPRSELKNLANNLGSYAYAGQYSQSPAPTEGGLFKERYFDVIGFQEYLGVLEKAKIIGDINFDLDTAFTKNQENDPSAILCTRKIDNILYVLDVKEVWFEMPELIEHCKKDFITLGYGRKSRIRIEPKASGLSTIQTLRKETNFNVLGDSQSKEEKEFFSGDKRTRANNILPQVEAKRVVFVNGNWNEKFLDQLKFFPNAKHDDMVDTLVQAVYYELYKSTGKGSFYMS